MRDLIDHLLNSVNQFRQRYGTPCARHLPALRKGMTGLLLLVFLQGATCNGPEVAETGCAPDIPVCICDPNRAGCQKEGKTFSNAFSDRSKTTLRKEFAETAGAPPLNPKVLRPNLLGLQRQLGAKLKATDLGELVVFAHCDVQVCRGGRADLLDYMNAFLNDSPNLLLEESEELADMTIGLKQKGQQLVFEAVDREGLFGDAGSVVARSTADVAVLETEWSVVAVPAYEYDANEKQSEAAPLRYQIQRRLVSRQEFGGSGGNVPQTDLNFDKAEQHCEARNATLSNVHVLEYALRWGVIKGHQDAVNEMLRLTNPEDDYEATLIHYNNHNFDFDSYLAKVLTFNWRTGEYEEAANVSQRKNMGFRCSRLEEMGNE